MQEKEDTERESSRHHNMSLYTVLDIGPDASDFELEQAFRSRSLQFLPSLDSRDHREFYAVSDAFQSE